MGHDHSRPSDESRDVAVNLKVGVDVEVLVEVYDLAATAQGPLLYTP
jgi:hypothetical protein